MARPTSSPTGCRSTSTAARRIDHVVVYTLQDNYANPAEPTDTLTFNLYGVTAFTVQGWKRRGVGAALGSVTGNNLVKRTVPFTAYGTDRIRINITGPPSFSRITEVEAWTSRRCRR